MTYITEERKMLKDMAAQFTNDVVLPLANELDPKKGKIPRDLIEQMGELGFFGIKTEEKWGGSNLGCLEYCLVAEELSRGWMSVASLIARSNTQVFASKDEEWKQEFLPRMAKGDYLTAVALSEPNVGSDLSSLSCRAERDGDEFVLTGAKYWCTYADDADAIIVFARSQPKSEDPRKAHLGISAFLVDKPRGELPERCGGAPIPKIGYYGWNTMELAFDGTRIPASALLGEEGQAFKMMMSGLETARAHTAARAIGLAQGALDCAIQYSKERIQFGKPISAFQETRFKIARCASEVEAARQLMYSVADKIDQGGRCDTESSMVKWYATEMAERVTSDCLQILGGAGYTTLYPVERYWRDARLTKIFEGTSEIQLRIISDRLIGR